MKMTFFKIQKSDQTSLLTGQTGHKIPQKNDSIPDHDIEISVTKAKIAPKIISRIRKICCFFLKVFKDAESIFLITG